MIVTVQQLWDRMLISEFMMSYRYLHIIGEKNEKEISAQTMANHFYHIGAAIQYFMMMPDLKRHYPTMIGVVSFIAQEAANWKAQASGGRRKNLNQNTQEERQQWMTEEEIKDLEKNLLLELDGIMKK